MPFPSRSNSNKYATFDDGDNINCEEPLLKQQQQQQQQSHRRKLSFSPKYTPARLRGPSTPSSRSQKQDSMTQASGTPSSSQPVHSGNTLESYVLPHNLRMNLSDMNLTHSGMEVIKVSKNGKQQTRRIAISPNHRSIFITTNRSQGGVLGLLSKKGGSGSGGASDASGFGADLNEVDLSLVVRMQLGQQSRRFARARAKLSKHPTTPGRRSPFQTEQNSNDDHFSSPKNSTNASKSLSIIYRPITNSTISSSVGSAVKENFVSTMTKSASVGTHSNQLIMDDGGDSLDLIIPSKNDYDELVLTLQNLLELYQEEEVCSNPDLALIHYHLVDMGKRIGSDGKPCLVSNSEWVDLCKRWNVPLTKAEASTMYCNHSETLGTGISSDDGLELSEIVQMLNQLRLVALERVSEVVASPRSGTEQNHISVVDPRKRLFQRVTRVKHDGMKTGTSTPNEPGIGGLVNDLHHATFEVISATAFLQFLHEKQKETNMTLDDVKFLFEQLNGHRVSRQLGDAISVMSGKSVTEGVDWEREYITKDAFAKYLLMDVNDVFDPERACPSFSYMSEPLNNYWINTCHDTYLRRGKTSGSDQKQCDKLDLHSFTLALYRGARAIELDVWDGSLGSKDPRVRSGVTSFPDTATSNTDNSSSRSNPGLIFSDVILTISYFLQSEPRSFPIILLIENHCSLTYQEKMASDIEEILGKRGFLHNAPNSCSLPSPEQLVGKVIIKSKRPESLLDGATVLNDDFDDENRALVPPTFADYDSEDDVKENVIGFNSIGSIKAQSYTQKLTADQLFQIAKKEASEASGAAFAAQNNLIDCKKLAIHMQNHRDALLRDIGMSYNDLKKKREHDAANSINEYADEGTEVELLEDRIRVKEGASRAVQIAQLFSESVEESRLLDNAARAEARSEAELFEMARGDLTDKEILLAEAKEALQDVLKRKQDSLEASDRALAEARSNREYANNAKNRVAAVTALLDKSHDQAVSSETVAGTADAEAKISEQRARDAEARAEKARASAESERKSAEKETKLEDDLDAQLVTTHKKLIEAKNAVKAARERADDAVCRAEKVTDEIREAKSSPRHQHINETTSSNGLDDEKSIESFANQKSKERRLYIDQMENALTDKLSCEAKARRLENIIEDIKRKTKLQAKVAAVARRQADHADQLADQLEEHALEEREAANLRQAARAKAKLGVKSSDDVLTSTEAQLVEAERASAEANDLAVESRLRAEELAKEAEAMQDSSSFEENVRAAQKSRDLAYSVYESAKESKEEADERAAKAKQVHETNCLNMSNLERDAMAELLHRESAQQAEVLAMSACENAKAQHDQIKILEVKYSEARALVTEKEGALEIAKRYKEKKSRVQPISPTMAKLTLLHSSKLRNWEKSNMLPKWNVHSLSDNMIIERAEKGVDEWREWVHYNSDHFSRTFPSSTTSNYNPLLPWAMGCQFVSLNFIDNDDYIFLNDGRFRVNGNQGYVLKPEYLCGNEKDSPAADDVFNCNHPRKLNIRILSGYCLPKPISAEKKGQRRSVNPFVRVTLYDGSPATFLPPQSFTTQIVHGNGMNPVWNSKDPSNSANFSCLNPSVGMLLFSVYDRCDVTNADLLISASAVPVSCIREGFRCVPMYDSNNTRSGAMKFASLFIYVKVF